MVQIYLIFNNVPISTYEEMKKALDYTYDSQITSLENESYPDIFGMRSKLDCYFKGSPVSITTYTYSTTDRYDKYDCS